MSGNEEPEKLTLYGGARELFAKTRDALDAHVGEHAADGEGWKLGGGTVLAARWKHRESDDLDVLYDADTDTAHFENKLQPAMEKAGGKAGPWGELSRIEFEDQHIDLMRHAQPAMKPKLVALQYEKPSIPEVAARARSFFEVMNRRRTVRDFSPARVPAGVIEDLVRAASTAPSGAHRQPWTFVAVSDPDIKRRIRIAAEREEHENYGGRMPDEWLRALEPLGTDEHKPFLEIAPWLVVLFRQNYGLGPDGEHVRHYYVSESVGIAAGLFLTAVHQAGLVALTHTPSPMGFLREILNRPANESACLLIPVGYPAADARVPDLRRKPLEDILQILRE